MNTETLPQTIESRQLALAEMDAVSEDSGQQTGMMRHEQEAKPR